MTSGSRFESRRVNHSLNKWPTSRFTVLRTNDLSFKMHQVEEKYIDPIKHMI